MKIKKVVCDISRVGDNIKIDTSCLLIKHAFSVSSKSEKDYEIITQFTTSEPFKSDTMIDEVASIGAAIKTKLQECGFERAKITLLLDFECLFRGKINLPKIRSRNLSTFFYQELYKYYGESVEERFNIDVKTLENSNGGYTFDITFLEKNIYRKILRIFTTQSLKVDEVYYLPDLYTNFFNKKEGDLHSSNVGVIITGDETRIFLQSQDKILHFKRLPLVFVGNNDEELTVETSVMKLSSADQQNVDIIIRNIFSLLTAFPEVNEFKKIYVQGCVNCFDLLRLAFVRPFAEKLVIENETKETLLNHAINYVVNGVVGIPCLPLKVQE